MVASSGGALTIDASVCRPWRRRALGLVVEEIIAVPVIKLAAVSYRLRLRDTEVAVAEADFKGLLLQVTKLLSSLGGFEKRAEVQILDLVDVVGAAGGIQKFLLLAYNGDVLVLLKATDDNRVLLEKLYANMSPRPRKIFAGFRGRPPCSLRLKIAKGRKSGLGGSRAFSVLGTSYIRAGAVFGTVWLARNGRLLTAEAEVWFSRLALRPTAHAGPQGFQLDHRCPLRRRRHGGLAPGQVEAVRLAYHRILGDAEATTDLDSGQALIPQIYEVFGACRRPLCRQHFSAAPLVQAD